MCRANTWLKIDKIKISYIKYKLKVTTSNFIINNRQSNDNVGFLKQRYKYRPTCISFMKMIWKFIFL